MKRLEHSDLVEACKTAVQEIVDKRSRTPFGRDDVIKLVLKQHPEIDDLVRLEQTAQRCLDAMHERFPTIEQLEIMSAEVTRHADFLITSGHFEEGIAYRRNYQAGVEKMVKAMAVDAYALKIDAEVLMRSGDACTGDFVRRVGGDAFIEAVKEELRRDGQIDPDKVFIPEADNLSVPMEDFMHWFRVQARRILTNERPKITFYFPTGPEEAAS